MKRRDFLTGVVLLPATGAGCRSKGNHISRHLVVGADSTASGGHRITDHARTAMRLVRQLSHRRDAFTLLRVERTTTEIVGATPPSARQTLQSQLTSAFASSSSKGGTCPAGFWTAAADSCSRSDRSVEIIFFTDGENDDASLKGQRQLAEAVRRLAAHPRLVRVTVAGVMPENRASLRRVLAPLGNRLQLIGPDELSDLDLAPLRR